MQEECKLYPSVYKTDQEYGLEMNQKKKIEGEREKEKRVCVQVKKPFCGAYNECNIDDDPCKN